MMALLCEFQWVWVAFVCLKVEWSKGLKVQGGSTKFHGAEVVKGPWSVVGFERRGSKRPMANRSVGVLSKGWRGEIGVRQVTGRGSVLSRILKNDAQVRKSRVLSVVSCPLSVVCKAELVQWVTKVGEFWF
jgi:hypothetical protein